jgi:hypothetical protein
MYFIIKRECTPISLQYCAVKEKMIISLLLVRFLNLSHCLMVQKVQKNAGRTFAEGLCGRALRNWRSTLNTEFFQKGKDARDVYGNIPLAV